MKILVIGSEGNIGVVLTRYLKTRNHEVFECDWKPGYRPNYFQADITMPLDLMNVFDQVKPQAVYLLAAMVSRVTCENSPSMAVNTNLAGVQNVAELCKKHASKLVYLSTSEVYGNLNEELIEDSTIPRPNNRYGLTKYLGEKIVEYEVMNHGLKAITVRPFMFYHETETRGDHRSAMIRFAEHLSKGQRIEIHRGSERAWMHLDDAVEALEAVLYQENYEVFNIGHEQFTPTEQIAEKIADRLGIRLDDYSDYIELPSRMTLVKRPNVEKMKNKLGVVPKISIDTGIDRILAEFR